MNGHKHIRTLSVFVLAMIALILSAAAPHAAAKKATLPLSIKKIFFEYNSTASALGDLGVHVFLDGEDWREIKIVNPNGRAIFEVEGQRSLQGTRHD